MSAGSRQYTVAIKLIDKDGLLAKLGSVGGGGKGGSSSGGGSNVLDKIAGAGAGQLLKLTGIGLGIAELVKIGVKSSGILQANFKLWETSMTLIFRPITDFIGLVLRPFTLAFLALALPFYRAAGPLFRQYGKDIASFFTANPGAMLATIAGALAGAWILKQTAWPKLEIPKLGGNGGGGSNGGFQFPKCIEICDKSLQKLTVPQPTPTPTSIPTPLPVPIPLPTPNPRLSDGVSDGINQSNLLPMISAIYDSDLITRTILQDIRNSLKSSLLPGAPKNTSIGISDSLKIGDSTSIGTASSMDWSKVIASGAGAAAAATAIEMALSRASTAIASGASRLESMVSAIPNGTAFGFAHFGPGGEIVPSSTRARTQMAGMVGTLT